MKVEIVYHYQNAPTMRALLPFSDDILISEEVFTEHALAKIEPKKGIIRIDASLCELRGETPVIPAWFHNCEGKILITPKPVDHA